MPELKVGDEAPDFETVNDQNEPAKLSDYRGKKVVLYFYPKDNTPGCTQQACGFRDSYPQIQSKDAVVLGVSPDSARSHTNFRSKFELPFPLLVDRGQKVAALYHASGLFVKRTVYLIGPDGKIRFGRRGMPPPSEVLTAA